MREKAEVCEDLYINCLYYCWDRLLLIQYRAFIIAAHCFMLYTFAVSKSISPSRAHFNMVPAIGRHQTLTITCSIWIRAWIDRRLSSMLLTN